MTDSDKNEISAIKGISDKYALVAVDVKGIGRNTYTYNIPDELYGKIKTGSPVIVPFGHQDAVNGFVVGFTDKISDRYKLKDIIDISDESFSFSPEYMQLLIWTAKYYICDLNSVIQSFMPSKIFGKYKTKVIKLKDADNSDLSEEETELLSLTETNIPVLSGSLRKKLNLSKPEYLKLISKLKYKGLIKTVNLPDDNKIKIKTQKYIKLLKKPENNKRFEELANILSENNDIPLSGFLKNAKTTLKTLEKMENENIVSIYEKEIFRNPLKIYENLSKKQPSVLSDEQQKVFDFISKKIDEKSTEPVLIHGITASGKTEVYFALIDKVLNAGKNVLFLAPEIAIASMLTKKTVQRYGTDIVAIWHSGISDREKNDIRELIKRGKIRIIIGARSAVFAPLNNIGLIIADEEHESSYKQTSPQPYYNAVEVAEKLAVINGAAIVKGSATPDICSYYKALKTGNLTELLSRYNDSPLPPVKIIDMKDEFSEKGQKKFSTYLKSKINENLESKKQTILLINRLGYATKIQCPNCGEILKCPKCGIPLIYHKSQKIFKCNWCDYQTNENTNCPNCGNTMNYYGLGVEKTEEIAAKLFPDAKIARLDSEILKGKYSHAKVLERFDKGEIDILIGTQMTAKGLDNPNVTLVGVINSDSSFVFPDFRSSERGFQLLTQVAGRAGRGDNLGEVVFQTFNPDYSVITFAKEQNYKKFYEEEIKLRKEFGYPPFSQVIRVIIRGKDIERTQKAAEEISVALKEFTENNNLKEKLISSCSSPCAFEKIDDFFRFEILIKNFADKTGHLAISKFYKKIKTPSDIQTRIFVSPLDLL